MYSFARSIATAPWSARPYSAAPAAGSSSRIAFSSSTMYAKILSRVSCCGGVAPSGKVLVDQRDVPVQVDAVPVAQRAQEARLRSKQRDLDQRVLDVPAPRACRPWSRAGIRWPAIPGRRPGCTGRPGTDSAPPSRIGSAPGCPGRSTRSPPRRSAAPASARRAGRSGRTPRRTRGGRCCPQGPAGPVTPSPAYSLARNASYDPTSLNTFASVTVLLGSVVMSHAAVARSKAEATVSVMSLDALHGSDPLVTVNSLSLQLPLASKSDVDTGGERPGTRIDVVVDVR